MSKFLENSIKDVINKYSTMFLTKKNVIGVGLAYKIIKGITTKEPILHIMVEKKVSKENLYKKDLIPSNFLGIKTDVVEVGETTYLSMSKKKQSKIFNDKIRPLQGGCSISPINRNYAATLTAIVFDNNDNSKYLLGTNHTLADLNKLPINRTLIVQPAALNAFKNIFNTVAILSKFVPITFNTNENDSINYVDCAIAKILPSIKTSLHIHEIGLVKGTIEAELDMPLRKFGIRTGYREGIVKAIHVTRIQKSPSGGTSTFYEQIVTTPLSKIGDSGALVLNFYNKAVGLISCAGKSSTYLSPIEYVLSYLNIHF